MMRVLRRKGLQNNLLTYGLALFSIVIFLSFSAPVAAATSSWQSPMLYGDWSDEGSWQGGVPNDSAAVVEFSDYDGGWFEGIVRVDGNYSVASLVFTQTSTPPDYSLICDDFQSISLYSSVVSSGSIGAIIQCPLLLNNNILFSGTSSGTYTYMPLSGAGGVTLDAHPGFRLYTTAEATYSGKTYINNGIFQAGYNNTLSPNSDFILANSSNAVLQFGGPIPNTIGSLSGGEASIVDLWGGTLTVGNNTDTTFAGTIIDGSGNNSQLVKQGSGSLTLTGDSTYTGETTIAEGSLSVNGLLMSSEVVVQPGAILRGTGNIPLVTAEGTVAPGNSIGTLNGAHFKFTSGSTLENEITVDGQTDLINTNNSITIEPGAILKIVPEAGIYTPGKTYTIMRAPTITGTFSSIVETSGNLRYKVLYYADRVDIVIEGSGNLADTGMNKPALMVVAAGLIAVGNVLIYRQINNLKNP